jgi:pimeloyl-ACP methyl ester carboxylesterase
VVEVLHEALDAAGITTPLLVGHSMAAALASLYAARHPAAGVVNVDQPPVIADFARLLSSLEPRLRGPAFDDVWREVFFASFRTDLLPETARELVTQHSRPTQELVLSYWQILLDRPLEDTEALIERALTGIAARDIPYVLVLGGDLDDAVRAHLLHRLPRMRVVEWLGTGHFPHLARPAEFADLLDQLGGASA